MNYYDDLLELLKTHSFKSGNFTLSSGGKSNFFIDCKQSILTANGHYLTGNILFDTIIQHFPTTKIVAGVALGGCSLASATSLISEIRGVPISAIYIRKQTKNHGSQKLIEGDRCLTKNNKILLLEDVITTGKTTLKAIKTLKKFNIDILGVISLIDREEGGKENLEKNNIQLISLYKKQDFFERK